MVKSSAKIAVIVAGSDLPRGHGYCKEQLSSVLKCADVYIAVPEHSYEEAERCWQPDSSTAEYDQGWTDYSNTEPGHNTWWQQPRGENADDWTDASEPDSVALQQQIRDEIHEYLTLKGSSDTATPPSSCDRGDGIVSDTAAVAADSGCDVSARYDRHRHHTHRFSTPACSMHFRTLAMMCIHREMGHSGLCTTEAML